MCVADPSSRMSRPVQQASFSITQPTNQPNDPSLGHIESNKQRAFVRFISFLFVASLLMFYRASIDKWAGTKKSIFFV